MSIGETHTSDICCDYEGCMAYESFDFGSDEELMRQDTAADGWTYIDGLDYCPQHSKQEGQG